MHRGGAAANARRRTTQDRARIIAGSLALALALVGVTACSRSADAGDLETRAREYQELKQRRQWDAIYDGFLDPESRKRLEKERFLKRRKTAFDVLSYSVVSTSKENGTGKVVVEMEAMVPVLNPGGGTRLIRKKLEDPQRWVNRDGRWYIELES